MQHRFGNVLKEMQDDKGNIQKGHIIAIPANSKIKANAELTMGKGFALEVARKYSSLPRSAAMAVRLSLVPEKDRFFGFTFIAGTSFALFQSKRNPQEPSDYKLIEDSIRRMVHVIKNQKVSHANQFNTKARGLVQFEELHIPLPGSGLGGLDREVLLEMFETLLPKDDDRFVLWELEKPEEIEGDDDDE